MVVAGLALATGLMAAAGEGGLGAGAAACGIAGAGLLGGSILYGLGDLCEAIAQTAYHSARAADALERMEARDRG